MNKIFINHIDGLHYSTTETTNERSISFNNGTNISIKTIDSNNFIYNIDDSKYYIEVINDEIKISKDGEIIDTDEFLKKYQDVFLEAYGGIKNGKNKLRM